MGGGAIMRVASFFKEKSKKYQRNVKEMSKTIAKVAKVAKVT